MLYSETASGPLDVLPTSPSFKPRQLSTPRAVWVRGGALLLIFLSIQVVDCE